MWLTLVTDKEDYPLTGWLLPEGEFVEVGYMGHRDWAHDRCEELKIECGLSAVDAIRKRGYVQISDGYAFLFDSDRMRMMELTPPQFDFLLSNAHRLDEATHHTLQEDC